MMDIFNMLGGMGQAQQQVSRQLGTDPQQAGAAIEAAVPLLLGALTRNASQPGGLDALSGALNRHDGSALDQFQQGGMPDMRDGQNILGHVFGQQQSAAANAVSRRAGIDPQMAMQVLGMLAPLVMAYLGRQRQGGAMGGPMGGGGMGGDLGSVLGGLLGGGMGGGGLGGMLGGLLGGGQQPPQQGYTQQQGYGQQGQYDQQQGYGQSADQYQQDQYQQQGGLGSGPVMSGYQQGLPSGGGSQMGTPGGGNLGGMIGTLNNVLDRDGDGNALDDLIGMFGGQRR